MDNEQKLLRIRESAAEYLVESADLIRYIVPDNLLADLEGWLPGRRYMDPAIFISRALCDLEGREYRDLEFRVSVLAGSAAAISDDILDERQNIPFSQIRLFEDYEGETGKGNLGLFYVFNRSLLKSLPPDFTEKFERIIKEYNLAQEDSSRLFGDIEDEEVIDIKNRAGGYSILLLYSMLFPENSFAVDRPVYLSPPLTKHEALYTFGAWLSRVDDLWDAKKDVSKGMKQLATKGLVTWKSLPGETLRMRKCLEDYFPEERVTKMMDKHYAPLMDIDIFTKYGG